MTEKEDIREWKAASNLQKGDNLITENGEIVYVEEVRVEKLAEKVTVYNLEVEELHVYYVAGVLVHNICGSDSGETILSSEHSHDSARNTLMVELDETGAFVNGSNKYIGRLNISYGYGKQIGRQSLNGKVRWRLDYDEKIGVHYNIEDFSKGKGANAVKKVIPIDISYDEYKRIIDSWN